MPSRDPSNPRSRPASFFAAGTWRWLAGVLGLTVCAGVIWWMYRPPPGKWKPGHESKKLWNAWEKEQSWRKEPFTPIADTGEFRDAFSQVPTRVTSSVDPRELAKLRELLYRQLLARATGSLSDYQKTFAGSRTNPLSAEQHEASSRAYRRRFGALPTDDQDQRQVFEALWQSEYGDHRFCDVSLGPKGSLIVVGDVRDASAIPPAFFLTPEELLHWNRWPGASMTGCAIFHPGPKPLETILEERGTVTYAQVVMVIRSCNDEVWCWESNWYLDPVAGDWQIHGALSVTLRGPYLCPI